MTTISMARITSWCLAAIIVVSACSDDDTSAPRIVQPGAPGETGRVLGADEQPEVHVPEHTEADVEFVQAMIAHHEQAVRMTDLVPDRTSRDDVPLFAERIALSQQDEIDLMVAWLEERGESVPDDDHHHEGPDGEPMPGMLTEEQFAQLETAEGDEFDRLFLDLMYFHHAGALEMVQDLLDSGNGEQPELWRLVNDIDSDQRIEMGRIEMMLTEMYGDGDG